jgi:hypothetical protein
VELYSHYAIRLRGFQRDDVAFTSENCKSMRRRYVTDLPPTVSSSPVAFFRPPH